LGFSVNLLSVKTVLQFTFRLDSYYLVVCKTSVF
jgi:hypothetical protein